MKLERVFYVYIFALCVLKCYLTLIAFTSDYPTFTSDAREYLRIAHNLIEHGAFSSDLHPPFRHDVIRVPMYPVLLTIFTPKTLIVLQHLLLLFSSFVLFRKGYRREGLLLFFSPTMAVFANQNLTEGIYAPLLVPLLLYRGTFWGFLWGLMALLRQATLVLFPPLLAVVFWGKWRKLLLHSLLFLVPVVLWATVNYLYGKIFTLSAGFHTSLLMYLVSKFAHVSDVVSHENFLYLGDWIRVITGKVITEIMRHPYQSLFWWLTGSLFTVIKAVARGYLQPFGPLWPLVYLLFYPYLFYLYRRALGDRRLTFLWVFYILAVGPIGDPRLRLPLEVLTLGWPLLRGDQGR